jgi:beta-glucosidase
VDLEPGESAAVEFSLGARDLSYWSTRAHGWVLEAGGFELAVGASSRDLRLTAVVDVAAAPLRVELDDMATLQEWLADPAGSALLRKAVGTDQDGVPNGILGNEQEMRVVGNFPMSTLTAFPGLGISRSTVQSLTEEIARQG